MLDLSTIWLQMLILGFGFQADGLGCLAPHPVAHDRNRQQAVKSGRWQLVVHALLELDPWPQHRKEDAGTRAPQVGGEGVERLGEVRTWSAT